MCVQHVHWALPALGGHILIPAAPGWNRESISRLAPRTYLTVTRAVSRNERRRSRSSNWFLAVLHLTCACARARRLPRDAGRGCCTRIPWVLWMNFNFGCCNVVMLLVMYLIILWRTYRLTVDSRCLLSSSVG